MDVRTISQLNKMNQDFYERIAPLWNMDPEYFWSGWSRLGLRERFGKYSKVRVLDVGCGNARFANFLQRELADLPVSIEYTGVDSSEFLWQQARENVVSTKRLEISLYQEDVLDKILSDFSEQNRLHKSSEEQFDLIVMFGVMHHVPGFWLRRKMLRWYWQQLAIGGVLVWTTWEFERIPRLRKRILSPGSEERREVARKYDFEESELEVGDYILDWVKEKKAYRYSHSFSQQEVEDLRGELSEVSLLDNFWDDGWYRQRNRYVVWGKG